MFKKTLILCGAAGALVYIVAVLYGGANWEGYDAVRQTISELMVSTAPNLTVLKPLFMLYGVLLTLFSFSFFLEKGGKLNKPVGLMLAICGLASVLLVFFPVKDVGSSLVAAGPIHLALAGIAAVTTILAVFLSVPDSVLWGYRNLKPISLVLGIIILLSGAAAAMAPKYMPGNLGLLERVTIGTFMLWLLINSLVRYFREENLLITGK